MLHILGAGSIGLLWAARLQRAGFPVQLILRNAARLSAWQDQAGQLEMTDPGQQQHVSLTLNAELPDSPDPIRFLLVATKAYAAEAAVSSVQHRLSTDAQVLLLQNGLGSQQAISRLLPHQRIFYASVTDGAWRPSAHQLIWAGHGQTIIGDPRQGPPPEWLTRWQEHGLTLEWHADILAVLWRKLAVNCAINPLTVLLDCPNGELLQGAHGRLEELSQELALLLSAFGIPLSLDILRTQLDQVIHQTATNSSSMRQDVHHGRRTEIDFMLGFALRSADQLNLAVPALRKLNAELQTYLATHGLPLD
ncbi:2-dehydropantoate 2-reductase [Halopseudomonas salegens]|uniref:2-dehydropantoate 2-reductase n=1 Tax=Halopseudomonas salegens TaxID=1434072 RepID=A0A1H2EME2_9GAMM|nr:2-dehydropantoate 2-reductase [Halopseudomonas salegens]SDT96113.1 ketopantoate reductase [Halopseudomonas salegens]